VSEVHSEGMTHAEATAAIEAAVSADPDFSPQAAQAPAPVEAPEPAAEPAPDQAAQPTPEVEPTPGATEFESADSDEDSFMGNDFNPDLLPDELKPGFKQLQAAFTKRTQEVAEQRKQFEEFGDPERIRQSLDLYDNLQNPEYLQSFHAELGNVLQEMGLSPAEAAAAAQDTIDAATDSAPSAAPELAPDLAKLVESDPEMAPLASEMAKLQAELKSFRDEQANERQALEDERLLMAQANEIDRQVQVVKEAHPDYKDDDWSAIYERAVYYDGNVIKAAELFEADRARIIAEWTAAKPVPAGVTPLPGGGTVTEPVEEDLSDLTPKEQYDRADAAAQAYLAANDAQEFTG